MLPVPFGEELTHHEEGVLGCKLPLERHLLR